MFDVDFHAGFFNNFIDNLTTSTDNITDFVRIDVDNNDFWSIFGQIRSWRRDRFIHFVQDEQTAFFSLLKCILKNVAVDTGNLNVHLNSCNTFCCTSYLEVHISEMIFHTLNIRQDGDMLSVFDQTHCYSGYWCFDWHTSVHHSQNAGTDTCLGSRTVRFNRF
ncbi:hypothetical protein D3C71_1505620 [compost metagenome]